MLLLAVAFGVACENPVEPAASAAVLRFSLAGNVSAQVSAVRVQVAYHRNVGANRPLLDTRIGISANQQNVAVEVDIAPCLADPDHTGSEIECTVDVTISLIDTNDSVIDQKAVGPFTLSAGTSTTAPPVTFDALVASIDVTPANASVTAGGLLQLEAQPRSANGTALAGRLVTWTTSDASIAMVNTTGVVTGVAPGAATITATFEGVSGSALVTVVASSPGGGTLVPGDLRAGSISTAGEADPYTFAGQSGDRILLTLSQTAGFNAQFGIVARATVVSPGGTQVVQFNANSQSLLTLTETGTFTIRIEASNLVSTGDYSIGLERLSPLGPLDGTLVAGSLLTDSVSAAAEVDVFSFGGTTGDRILLTLSQTAGFNAPFGIVARAVVVAPSGAQLVQFNANSQSSVTLAETGTFTIVVFSNNYVSTGNYSLGLERLSPAGPLDGTLVAGSLLADSVSAAAEVDVFSFGGTTGDRILLTLSQTAGFNAPFGIVARAVVVAPSGAQLVQFNANSQSSVTLAETGTFTIVVFSNNYVSTGNYSLGLERLSPAGPLDGTLSPGTPVAGSIDAASEVDVFTFNGTAGGSPVLTLTSTGGFNPPFGIVPRVTVIAPSGAQVEQFNATAQRTLTLTETGTYVVYVTSSNLVSTGTYTVGIQ